MSKKAGLQKYRYITSRRDTVLMTVLCAAAYFCSYMTRINYKAVISAISASEGIAKDAAAAALTGLFITYGVGQLISGWLGDRINPKYLMSGGLLLASVMNIVLPLNPNPVYMTVIWCINGFGQAMMWPPIVKTLTNFLNENDYLHASVKVCWGSSFATVLIYLCAPLLMTVTGGWKSVFFVCAAVGAAGSVAVFVSLSLFEKKYAMKSVAPDGDLPQESGSPAEKTMPASEGSSMPGGRTVVLFFAILLCAIIVQGSLKDGVDTWMPAYISETFGLGTNISILSGVILPFFTIISYQVSTYFFEKVIKNEMTCGMFFYVLAGVCSAALLAVRGLSTGAEGNFSSVAVPCLSILLFALIIGCMHAINLLFTCFVPRQFRRFGNISWVSGLTNFGTYVGSAVATYGFAVLTEDFGWSSTVISWIIIAVTGALLCLAGFFPWKKLLKTSLG
ncbi:MAG: MFS transporter [Clostridia bacterium]|nr:MFS transporter [Clostridia bacterium]